MNAKEAALSMTLEEYRLWWYKQLGETPPEPVNNEWTVGQARDERLIRQGYEHRRQHADELEAQAVSGEVG